MRHPDAHSRVRRCVEGCADKLHRPTKVKGFYSWNCLVPVGRFRKLGVDVQHEEAEGLSSFACRGCVRGLELTERKVDEMRAYFLKATFLDPYYRFP